MNCNKCGNLLSGDSKFCIKCGEKVLDSTPAKVADKKPDSKIKKILYTIVALVVFFVTMAITRYATKEVVSTALNKTSQNNNYTTESLVVETVKTLKKEMSLPNQIDEVTKLIDITAEQKAIRYHYILSGADSSQLTNDYLKNYLMSGVCGKSETKAVLDQGIDMEYSYVISETQQKYFVTITKSDCLN